MTLPPTGKQGKHHRTRRTQIRRLALFVTLAVLLLSAPAAASGPDSHSQPLLDGCQRSDAMELGLSTPEWVYADRASVLAARAAGDPLAGTRTITGVVTESRPAGEDLYVNHDFNDMNVMVQPVMAHRVILRPESRLRKLTAATVVDDIMKDVPVPLGMNG